MSDFDSNRIIVVGDQSAAGLEVDPIAGGALTGVLDGVTTTIVTYTAAVKTLISHITVSGTVYAKYQLYKNATLIETRRGGPDRTLVFGFLRPLKLQATDILDVKVTHYVTTSTADFESTIYGG